MPGAWRKSKDSRVVEVKEARSVSGESREGTGSYGQGLVDRVELWAVFRVRWETVGRFWPDYMTWFEIDRAGSCVNIKLYGSRASLAAQMVKNLPAVRETWVWSWVGKSPWRRAWQPTPVFLPGESPWSEEPGGLRSMGLQKVSHNRATEHIWKQQKQWPTNKQKTENS